ncbi:nuclear transport factor 2 family protein [Lysinibacillus yapensis]|uniref:Nuclear transport factor 2 family protein n=1 Tax=Ureibacillus yapensis TaxID=2304605 RepID=A0A396SF80_9BACL|nr:nuclear transport factor 2 family protein [Lysinibacillus yapensis]RHW39945.1 nuclear transport factor 2 family protein [Lysinibacillus yapensis]
MNKWIMLVAALFLLSACNDKDEANTNEQQVASNESTVGFEITGDEVVEAPDIPKEEQAAIVAAFNEYIDSFNSKDIDRYVETLSKHPQGFNVEEDVEAAKQAFEQYDIARSATDVTIVKYDEEEAQVFANLDIHMTEIETNAELASSGRQVTVFVKEDNDWKVTSVYYIGDESAQ